jgi:hypothetical protein
MAYQQPSDLGGKLARTGIDRLADALIIAHQAELTDAFTGGKQFAAISKWR